MLLAFFVDQAQQLCCALFQAVWAKLGSKRLLWERMRALFYDYALESMRQLFEALFYGLKKSKPIIAVDSSSSLHRCSCDPTPSYPAISHRFGKATPPRREGSASTRPPVISDRESHFERQKPMVETLRELSTTMVA